MGKILLLILGYLFVALVIVVNLFLGEWGTIKTALGIIVLVGIPLGILIGMYSDTNDKH